MKNETKRKLIWTLFVAIIVAAFWCILKFLAASTVIVNAVVIMILMSIGLGVVFVRLMMFVDRLVNKICCEKKPKKTCDNCLYNIKPSSQSICRDCYSYCNHEPVEDE